MQLQRPVLRGGGWSNFILNWNFSIKSKQFLSSALNDGKPEADPCLIYDNVRVYRMQTGFKGVSNSSGLPWSLFFVFWLKMMSVLVLWAHFRSDHCPITRICPMILSFVLYGGLPICSSDKYAEGDLRLDISGYESRRSQKSSNLFISYFMSLFSVLQNASVCKSKKTKNKQRNKYLELSKKLF